MELRFTKMHGLGNDFMVLDALSQPVPAEGLPLAPRTIRWLADRRFGIGFDQLLVVRPPPGPDVDFGYGVFNADGGEVYQCGNGARCFARFVREQGYSDADEIRVATAAGEMTLTLTEDGEVTVAMGEPLWSPQDIPFNAQAEADTYTLEAVGETLEISAVGLGNPHCVALVDNLERAPVNTLGPVLEKHPDFPEQANAGFMQVLEPDHIRLRVHERGVGETLACGSGACAAMVCGRRRGLLGDRVRVSLPGGDLLVTYDGSGQVRMTGPATRVYDGVIEIDNDNPGGRTRS